RRPQLPERAFELRRRWASDPGLQPVKDHLPYNLLSLIPELAHDAIADRFPRRPRLPGLDQRAQLRPVRAVTQRRLVQQREQQLAPACEEETTVVELNLQHVLGTDRTLERSQRIPDLPRTRGEVVIRADRSLVTADRHFVERIVADARVRRPQPAR